MGTETRKGTGRVDYLGPSSYLRSFPPFPPRIATEGGIQVALSFINDSCTSTHGNINVNSIFISPSGEWRLGGFEVLSTPKEENAVLYVCIVHLHLELPDHTLE